MLGWKYLLFIIRKGVPGKMYDYHLHSNFSFDCQEDLNEICQQAIRIGLTGICFTDHCDFETPSGKNSIFNIAEYQKTIHGLQKKYSGQLDIRIGIEVGMQKQNLQKTRDFLHQGSFDFVIASCHYIDGKTIFKETFCQGKSQIDAFRQYFMRIFEMVREFTDFQVLGHLDVIRRDKTFLEQPFHYADYGDIIDAIFRTIIVRGQGIEINTAAPRYGLTGFHPHLDILKRYRELGGEVITCGSDAHSINNIGSGIPEAYQMLKELGFQTISIFQSGKEKRIPL